MSDKRDYYEVLGLSRDAGKEDIKKAYRKLAMKLHPDRNPDDKVAEAKFKEASEAADVLLNDDKRSRYDQFGHAGVSGQAGGFGGGGFEGFTDLGDIFGDIFGDILGGQRSRGGRRSRMQVGADLQIKVNISFEEAAFGIERVVSLNRHVECPTCNGTACAPGTSPTTCGHCHGHGEVRRQQGFFTMSTICPSCQGQGKVIATPCSKCRGNARISRNIDLEVKIPAGINDSQRLKLSGEGDSGLNGGPRGDLYVMVAVSDHDFFEREDFDVFCTVPISFSQAALGTEMEVPTLKGRVKVSVPAGTQSGKKMRLKAKGVTRLGGHGFGDQIISIHVETPTKLCGEQQVLFQQLATLEKKECNPMSRNFFDKVKNLFQ